MAVPGRDGGAEADACADNVGGANSGAAGGRLVVAAVAAAAPGSAADAFTWAGESARTGVVDRDVVPS